MHRRLGCLLLAVSCLAACAAPPEKERQDAEAALTAARQAGAATYAPDDLRAAEAALQKYDAAAAQRDYRQALSSALDARDQANQAATKAASEKAAARRQAEQLLSELESLITTANERLADSGRPRLTRAGASRVRAAARAMTPVLQEARTMLQQQDYPNAVKKLTPAVSALRRELAMAK